MRSISRRSLSLTPALLTAFFLSGAAALVYQVLWTRRLGLVFGVTVQAASTVLACFMAGLAIGSIIAGRKADRLARPLSTFAVVEGLIGLAALATPYALQAVEALFVAWAPEKSALGRLALRAGLSSAVLIVPSTLMGATYPLVLRATAETDVALRRSASLLYGVNTGGAVSGVIIASFWLIPRLGMRATFVAAACINFTVAAIAWSVSRRTARGHLTAPTPAETVAGHFETPAAARKAILIVMAISGAVSIALEIIWFRVLVFLLRPTTYAFASMLAAVLVGIAAGSLLITPLLRRRANWLAHLGTLEIFIGLVGVVSGLAIVKSYGVMNWVWSLGLRPPLDFVAALIVPAAFAILPTALLLGAAFPVGLVLWSAHGSTGQEADAGRRIGTLYAVNVAGAIVGSLVAGFVLIPAVGAQRSLVLVTALPILGGLWLIWLSGVRWRLPVAVCSVLLFAVVVARLPDLFRSVIELRYEGREILWHREEAQSTITVIRDDDGRTLLIDGMHHANDSAGMARYHHEIGALGLALQAKPGRVLVVGLGGGATAGAVSTARGVFVDVVELSPAVVEAARWFERSNRQLLQNPYVHFRIDDGRNYLLLTHNRYDVVTADLMLPYLAGAGNLYSADYFRLARRVLSPGGVMVQWLSQANEIEYKMMLRGFLDAFPYVTAWERGSLIVGSMQPLQLDEEDFDRKLSDSALADLFKDTGLGQFSDLLKAYAANRHQLEAYVGSGGPMLTDDLPASEYFLSLPAANEAKLPFPPPDPRELLVKK